MEQERLPEWEGRLVDEMIETACRRLADEEAGVRKRAFQLAGVQA